MRAHHQGNSQPEQEHDRDEQELDQRDQMSQRGVRQAGCKSKGEILSFLWDRYTNERVVIRPFGKMIR